MRSSKTGLSVKDLTPEQRAILIEIFEEMEAAGEIVRVPGTGDDPLTCTWMGTGSAN